MYTASVHVVSPRPSWRRAPRPVIVIFALSVLALIGGCPAREPAPRSTPPTEGSPASGPTSTPSTTSPVDADARAQPPRLTPQDPGARHEDGAPAEGSREPASPPEEESGSLRPDPLREPAADPRAATATECDGHAIGEEWKRDCNTCVCGPDGQATCTLMACGNFDGARDPR